MGDGLADAALVLPPIDADRIRSSASMLPNPRRAGPQILIAGICPVIAYSLLRPHIGSDALTLSLVMIFPLAELGYERLRFGRLEPIGMLAIAGIALGLVGALVFNGSTFLLKMRDSIFTGGFGLVCLASLAASRPVMFFLGREFATGGDRDRVAEFEQLWALPGIPGQFRLVTAVWGVGLLVECAGRTVLALSLSTGTFLGVALVWNGVVLASLFVWTGLYNARKKRRLVERLEGEAAIAAAIAL